MTTSLSRSFCARLLPLLAVAVIAVSGCSGKGIKKVTVSGTVSYKGQRLQSGILKFVGDGSYSAASIQPDGTFIITDVVPGEVKVGIMEAPGGSGSSSSPDGVSSGPKGKPLSLPEKYREPETSGLKYTITPETKELAIDIKD